MPETKKRERLVFHDCTENKFKREPAALSAATTPSSFFAVDR